MSTAQSNGSGVDGLLALYGVTWEEITRLRDYEWKIAYYFVSLSVGLIIFVTNESLVPLLTSPVKWVLTGVQLMAASFGVFYLWMTHEYLTQQRNIRRRIEEALGLYDSGKFREKESVLPAEWKGQRITRRFQRLGLLIPLMTMVVLVQGFSVFVLWRVDTGKPYCVQGGTVGTGGQATERAFSI